MPGIRKKILGVNVDFGFSMEEAISRIDDLIKKKDGTYLVATTNPFFIMAAQEDPAFKDIVNKAVLSLPDGVGTLYANLYLNKIEKIPRNFLFPVKSLFTGLYCGVLGFVKRDDLGNTITGVDLSDRLFKLAEENNYTVFLLGGSKRDNKGNVLLSNDIDIAAQAANVIKSKYPNIRIVGSSSAYKRSSEDDVITLEYIHNIMKKESIDNIDVLLVAYNPVGQEKWINRVAKDIPATICVGVGRTFNYIANDMRKPPTIFEKMHIAWLYAFIIQPWRYKRVFMTFPIFPLKVFKESLKSQ